MSNSSALTPTTSIATAYKIPDYPIQLAESFSQALQPVCQLTGVSQSVTPSPSPSA